ncbi:DUF1120 domain-containing protein [Pseudomonas chlororaphis subsp. aureofaciens]|uniref:DUF1120 domain-containing protein n=1 Tax=Pseudomonas TaxID=286 RepID=UPI0023628BA0|nr:DUF1120 domain-containing protein [Pseudomonas sp. SBT1-2]
MNFKPLLTLLLLASTAVATDQASAVDLSVSGRISPSSACNLSLGNNGQIDLGTLSRQDLRANDETLIIHPGLMTLTIQCQTPTKTAIKAIDNRESSDVGLWGYSHYGLGIPGSQSRFWFYPNSHFGDGKPLDRLVSGRDGNWEVSAPPMYPSSLNAWAEEGSALPQAFKTISSELSFYIKLAAPRDLDLSREVVLDGSATLELVYL